MNINNQCLMLRYIIEISSQLVSKIVHAYIYYDIQCMWEGIKSAIASAAKYFL